ncbi:MAG: HVO_A0114 family putative DNA-binding protein [Nitrososphaerales archaeon]
MQTQVGLARKVIFKPVETEEEKHRLLKSLLKESGRKDETIFLLTPKEFTQVFTPERLRLVKLVKDRPELTITEISRSLNRRREAVSRDIRFFEGLGLIAFQKRGRTHVPKRVVQEISIRL